MPIGEKSDFTQRLIRNWRIEKGHYIAIIDDVHEKFIEDGRIPLCWELTLVEQGRKVEKLHWIDKAGGVNLLVNDLKAIGGEVTPENALETCNDLIGARILVNVDYKGEHQNISFIRRID